MELLLLRLLHLWCRSLLSRIGKLVSHETAGLEAVERCERILHRIVQEGIRRLLLLLEWRLLLELRMDLGLGLMLHMGTVLRCDGLLQNRGIERLILVGDVEDARMRLHLLWLLDALRSRQVRPRRASKTTRSSERIGHVGHGKELVEMALQVLGRIHLGLWLASTA